MNISQITGVYFSPTGGTKRVTEWITERIADNREAEWLDLTDAVSSRPDYTFTEHELVVVGVPVYGGRVPETARERMQKLHGKRTEGSRNDDPDRKETIALGIGRTR